jgi:glycosyltransferase involved in cell wall biosynthesis
MNKTAEPRSAVFLGAGSAMQCGVGHFTRLLFEATRDHDLADSTTLTLTKTSGSLRDIWRGIGAARNVVCNLPIVAWKRVIVRPLLALALARLRGRNVVLVLHEWGQLNWLRRVTYLPAVALANSIVVFSPLVQQELARDPWIGWLARRSTLAPLPPNVEAPAVLDRSPLRDRLAAARADGRIVLGHFGSIYPGKQPEALLAIGAVLKARGLRPLLVYIGSFVRGVDHGEENFYRRAAELGVTDDVIVSGFIESDHELYGLLSEVDVFCYRLSEGITARRASILASVQSGRPLVVTAPALAEEFDHHPRFRALIEHGNIVLVPRDADDAAYADAIVATLGRPTVPQALDFAAWWRDVAVAVSDRFRGVKPIAAAPLVATEAAVESVPEASQRKTTAAV